MPPPTPDADAAPAPTVRLHAEGGAAELILDRPAVRNAMSAGMVSELLGALDDVERMGVRALLVRGEGPAFCAGRDLSEAQPGAEDGEAVLAATFNPLVLRVAGLQVPTVAAVQGACLGTGLGLALACDIVYAADDARLGSPFGRIGAVLDSGAHLALVQRIGAHRTLELVYGGRLLSGREAEAWGLVNRSVAGFDLLRRARELVRAIAAGPTAAFLESKRLVRLVQDRGPTLEELLAAEAAAQGRASRTADYREGITAFLEKRQPTFGGEPP